MSAAASEAKAPKKKVRDAVRRKSNPRIFASRNKPVIKGEMPNLRAVYCALTTIVKA